MQICHYSCVCLFLEQTLLLICPIHQGLFEIAAYQLQQSTFQ